MSTSLLGLTVHCAQCHSHKFDPISQADYYRLAAVFTPSLDVQNWIQANKRHLHTVPPSQKARIDQHNSRVNTSVAELKNQLAAIESMVSKRLRETKLAALPEPVRSDTDKAVKVAKEKRNPIEAYLASRLGPLVAV